MRTEFTITTPGPGLTEITDRIAAWLPRRDGCLTLFVRHTSCSLLIQENADPDVCRDLEDWIARLVPHATDPAMSWLRHRSEGPDDMPAHIKAAHLPVSLSIPVADGEMTLGTWQGIYLWEHRDRGRSRSVSAYLS